MDPDRFWVPAFVGRHGWIGIRLDLEEPDWDEGADPVAHEGPGSKAGFQEPFRLQPLEGLHHCALKPARRPQPDGRLRSVVTLPVPGQQREGTGVLEEEGAAGRPGWRAIGPGRGDGMVVHDVQVVAVPGVVS